MALYTLVETDSLGKDHTRLDCKRGERVAGTVRPNLLISEEGNDIGFVSPPSTVARVDHAHHPHSLWRTRGVRRHQPVDKIFEAFLQVRR